MVKEVLEIIDIFLLAYMSYYTLTGIFAFIKRRKKKNYAIKNRFAVVIAARDEGKVIGNLLESLNKQNYPKELYDVYVLPNNCTDDTRIIAENMGAKIIDCCLKIKSKGEALRFAFNYLKEENYSAYLIFDADNIVHPNFIKEMNSCLNNGYGIAQGYRDSKNPSDTWISSSYSLHYLIQNTFVNDSRMNIRQSSFINGTGFMIAKRIIDKNGYESSTMTEDIEFTVKSAINNEKIAFAQDAITYDEQTLTLKNSIKQRKRWSIGTIQCLSIYWKDLLKNGIRKGRFTCIDSLLFLLGPFIQIISSSIFMIRSIAAGISNNSTWFFNQIAWTVLMYLTSIVISIIVIKMNNKKITTYIKGILAFPIFMLTWIPINLIALVNPKCNWEKIEHTRDVNIENLLKINC